MLWSLLVDLEPPSARWLEEVTGFVVSALMDVSVGDIFGTVAKCPNSEGSVLRQFFGCGDAVPSQQLCNISPTVDGLSIVKFEALIATINRDSCEFDTVVFSKLSDDLLIGSSSDVPAAMLSFALPCGWAAWPAWFVAWPCHLLGCFQLLLPDALLEACWYAAPHDSEHEFCCEFPKNLVFTRGLASEDKALLRGSCHCQAAHSVSQACCSCGGV